MENWTATNWGAIRGNTLVGNDEQRAYGTGDGRSAILPSNQLMNTSFAMH
jgi:hypothetical protein